MRELFLCAALALPWNPTQEYKMLEKFVAHYHPGYDILLINKDETLLNRNTEKTPIIYQGLYRVWIKRTA